MFPVQEPIALFLMALAWAAVGLPVARLVYQNPRWLVVFAAGLILAAVVVFADRINSKWEYAIDLFVFAVVAVMAFVMLIIGWLLHRFAPRLRVRYLVAATLVPATLAAGVVLAAQRVPDAACATDGVQVVMNGKVLDLPVELPSQILVPGTPGLLTYRDWRDHLAAKPDVRLICDLSAGGTRPLKTTLFVSNLWRLYDQDVFQCPVGAADFCKGLPAENGLRLNSVTMRVRRPADEDGKTMAEVYGDAQYDTRGVWQNGSVCYARNWEGCKNICDGWRRLPSGSTIQFSACQSKDAPDPAPHQTLQQALDWFEARMQDAP